MGVAAQAPMSFKQVGRRTCTRTSCFMFLCVCLFRCLQPARASLHRTLNALLLFRRAGVCARYKSQPVRPSRQRLGAQHQDACTWWGHKEPLGQADVQALASTNELGPTGLPLVVSPEASDPADVQAVGRTEASGPANAQVAGSTESLVANADVLQAPPLGAAPRGARVYVDVSDCHRSASLTTGPSVARCRSKRLLWKSPPSAPPAAGLVSPSVLMQSRWLQKWACSPCTMVC